MPVQRLSSAVSDCAAVGALVHVLTCSMMLLPSDASSAWLPDATVSTCGTGYYRIDKACFQCPEYSSRDGSSSDDSQCACDSRSGDWTADASSAAFPNICSKST